MTPSPRRMRFVGVSTASSSIMKVFPLWSGILGLDAELVGLDVPLGAPAEAYRRAVAEIRDDPACAGALVTTHKIAVFDAARDMFDDVDEFAASVGEISSIAVRGGRTLGAAKDPLTAGLALEEVLADDHFADGAQVLCLGAGGAGTAIGWYLGQRKDAPVRMTFVDPESTRLAHLREVLAAHAPHVELRTLTVGQADLEAELAALPEGSLVVNATGMGKDRPGSPLPAAARFPRRSVVWELNYRGSLEFLAQARAQERERELTVVDGWRYFIHGWSQVIAEVFELEMDPALVARLAEAAESVR
ncbi:saccharopine dehydrogenase NADP-binding domain-containing protein [Geodermatophilus sp. SYSU D00815]